MSETYQDILRTWAKVRPTIRDSHAITLRRMADFIDTLEKANQEYMEENDRLKKGHAAMERIVNRLTREKNSRRKELLKISAELADLIDRAVRDTLDNVVNTEGENT